MQKVIAVTFTLCILDCSKATVSCGAHPRACVGSGPQGGWRTLSSVPEQLPDRVPRTAVFPSQAKHQLARVKAVRKGQGMGALGADRGVCGLSDEVTQCHPFT